MDDAGSTLPGLLDLAFAPRRLGLYGASARPGSMGLQLTEHLVSGGFAGELVLVNPRPQTILERATVTSATQAQGPLDHALIAVPADGVLGAMEDAAAAGGRVATILTSGFSELGEEGARLEEAVRERAASLGLRLLGPNCLGFMSFHSRVMATSLPFGSPPAGSVSIIGQSGSVAGRLATGLAAASVGLDLWLTIGNAVDLGPAALVEYLAGRKSTTAIVLYLESIGPVEPFRRALSLATRAGKHVVMLKSGRSALGARAAASHTGATASPDVFVDILLRDAGAIRADSVQQAIDVATILVNTGRLSGKAAVVAPSGGDCTLAADRCEQLGVPLATISAEGQAAMKRAVPLCAPENPIDPTTQAGQLGKFEELLDIVVAEPDVDYLVFLTSTSLMAERSRERTAAMLAALGERGVPLVVGAPVSPAVLPKLQAAGISVIGDSERVFDAVQRVLAPRATEAASPAPGPQGPKPLLMEETQAMAALEAAGLPMIPSIEVRDAEEVKAAGERLGYPLVMKGVLPGVAHKSGLGLVKLGLWDHQQALAAFEDLKGKTATHPDGRIIVQPSVQGGLAELIIGVVDDPAFGKHVTVGMGGVWTDFLKERVWARAPVDTDQALRMLDGLSIGPGLKGRRKGVTSDVDGIAQAIVRLSRWAVDNDAAVAEVEINPLIVGRDSVMAVDALVALRDGVEPKGGEVQ